MPIGDDVCPAPAQHARLAPRARSAFLHFFSARRHRRRGSVVAHEGHELSHTVLPVPKACCRVAKSTGQIDSTPRDVEGRATRRICIFCPHSLRETPSGLKFWAGFHVWTVSHALFPQVQGVRMKPRKIGVQYFKPEGHFRSERATKIQPLRMRASGNLSRRDFSNSKPDAVVH